MFSGWLSGKYLTWYGECRNKARIDHVGGRLLAWKYGEPVIRNHLIEWLRFVHDFEGRGAATPQVYRCSEVEDYMQRRFPAGSASRYRTIRAPIRIFIEMDAAGNVCRKIRKSPQPRNELYQRWAAPYVGYLRLHGGLTDRTLEQHSYHLGAFTDFLQTAGVSCLVTELTGKLVHDFFCRLSGLMPATKSGYACTVRRFLRWAYIDDRLPSDFSGAAMTVRKYRLAGLPDVLTDDEVDKILGAVDQAHALGRRDYAILLLAARYGLRPSDIRRLEFENFDWRRAQISLRQSKTGRELALPLLPDVAAALIAYLRDGRPETDSRVIFVRHKAPFEPFYHSNNLAPIMRTALSRAGLGDRVGRRGLYLFRHTLATRMLAAGVPFKTIGDVLGHATTDSTLAYTKIDLCTLRTVAVGIGEVLS